MASPTKDRPSSSTSAAVEAVLFFEQHLDSLALRCGHVLAHVVGPDGQLPVAAVEEHCQLDRARTAVFEERVERRPHGPAVVDDVVDQNYRQPVDFRHL